MTTQQLALDIDVADHTDCGEGCRIATPEPEPRRCHWLMPGTVTWATISNAGHRCAACGHSCSSTAHHAKCCGHSDNHVRPGVCTGHPCRQCGWEDQPPSRFMYRRSHRQHDRSTCWDQYWLRGHGARMQRWRHQIRRPT